MKAVDEAYRILKPNGIIVMSSQMDYPIHDEHDYWRFIPEAFDALLRSFPVTFVESGGNPSFPAAVVGVGVKGGLQPAVSSEIRAKLMGWKQAWDHGGAAECFADRRRWWPGWKHVAKLLAPPILVELYRKLK